MKAASVNSSASVHIHPLACVCSCAAQQLAWAEEDQRQAHYDIVRAANATGDAEDEEDDSQLWTLAVSLFPSAHYPKAQRLVEQWAAHFAAASQTLVLSAQHFLHLRRFCSPCTVRIFVSDLSGVTVEGWGPSTIGVSIAESAMQPPPSVSSTVLSVVDFLAAQPAVEWIGTAAVFDTANKHASSISQSGVFGPPSRPLWERNLTGAGQVVSIGDTGVAWSSCFFHDPEVPVPFSQHRSISHQPHCVSTVHQLTGCAPTCRCVRPRGPLAPQVGQLLRRPQQDARPEERAWHPHRRLNRRQSPPFSSLGRFVRPPLLAV